MPNSVGELIVIEGVASPFPQLCLVSVFYSWKGECVLLAREILNRI